MPKMHDLCIKHLLHTWAERNRSCSTAQEKNEFNWEKFHVFMAGGTMLDCHGNIIPFGRKARKIKGLWEFERGFYTKFKPKN